VQQIRGAAFQHGQTQLRSPELLPEARVQDVGGGFVQAGVECLAELVEGGVGPTAEELLVAGARLDEQVAVDELSGAAAAHRAHLGLAEDGAAGGEGLSAAPLEFGLVAPRAGRAGESFEGQRRPAGQKCGVDPGQPQVGVGAAFRHGGGEEALGAGEVVRGEQGAGGGDRCCAAVGRRGRGRHDVGGACRRADGQENQCTDHELSHRLLTAAGHDGCGSCAGTGRIVAR